MQVILVANGKKTLILKPETPREKELLENFKNTEGTFEVKLLNENSAVLEIPVGGALVIRQINEKDA